MSSSKADIALKGVADLFLGQVASRIFTFLFLIAFVRLLSRDELAVLPLYYAASTASTLLFSFGILATLVREIPRLRVAEPEKMHSLLFTSFIVVMSGVIISTLLMVMFRAPIQDIFFSEIAGQIDFKLFAAGMVAGGWKSILSFVLKSLQMYRRLAIFTSGNDFLFRALGLVGFLIAGINGLLVGFLLGVMISNIYCTIIISQFLFSQRNWYPMHELLKISWPFYFESYLHYFRFHGDVLFIGALLGAPALSVFFVAKRLYDLLMTVMRSMEHVMAPSISQLLGHSIESAVRGYARMAALVPLAVVPTGLLSAGLTYGFIDVIGGKEYARDAFLPAALFCGVAVLHGLVAVRTSAVFVMGQPTDRLKIAVSQFSVYFSLLYLLVMNLGVTGAPLAQAASYIVAYVYSGYLLSDRIGNLKISKLLWIVLGSTLIGLVLLLGLQIYYYSIFVLPVYALLAIFTVILLVSLLTPDSEFCQLKNMLPSRLKKPFSIYMRLRSKITV